MSESKCGSLAAGLIGFVLGAIAVKVAEHCMVWQGCCSGGSCCCRPECTCGCECCRGEADEAEECCCCDEAAPPGGETPGE